MNEFRPELKKKKGKKIPGKKNGKYVINNPKYNILGKNSRTIREKTRHEGVISAATTAKAV